MLAFGYVVGFAVGMAGWAFILYEIFVGVPATYPFLECDIITLEHYFCMREYWVTIKQNPIVYRYIDWSLTVPLQMIELHCSLKVVKSDLSTGLF